MLRRLLVNLLLAAGAVAATLALAEVASWRLLPQWAPENGSRTFWRYDELLGWSHRPGASGVHRHPDFAARVEINAQGLRDRDYPEARVPGRCRLLVVGDSFTWGFGVQQDEIWHERIEARHPDWEIVNAGVAGYATDQELLYLEHRGLALQPDAVLLLFHPNDLLENAEHATSGYYKPYFERAADGSLALRQVPVPAGSLEQRVDRWLHFHTYLLYRLYHARKFIVAAREERAARAASEARPGSAPPGERRADVRGVEEPDLEPARAGESPPGGLHEEPRSAGRPLRTERRRPRPGAESAAGARDKYDVDVALTLELLARVDALVREHGARLLVASVPFESASRPRLEEGLHARGIAYAGLDAAFRRQRDVRFPGDPHWTPHGHALAAEAIEAFLASQGVLEACAAGRAPGARPAAP